MHKPILVILAAGMGSRYGALKQIDAVGPRGEAILDYSLFDARRAGFSTVVFIIKHEIETAFQQTVGKRAAQSGMEIRYAFQQLEKLPAGFSVPEGRVKPWGTAHAILCAKEVIDAPFAVINADDYYGPTAFAEMYRYLSQTNGTAVPRPYAMVSFLLQNTVSKNGSVSRGICEKDAAGNLKSVTEHTKIFSDAKGIRSDLGDRSVSLPGDTPVSMNLWGFQPDFTGEIAKRFPAFLEKTLAENPQKGEFYLPSVVSSMLEDGTAQVRVLESQDKWYGVTYQADKPLLMNALRRKTEEGLYPSPLWE